MTITHTLDIKVRGYHLDLFAHVNNARYLEFLEEARWAAFEKTVDLQKMARAGHAFTVVNINISYRRPALMNDILTLETYLASLGKRSGVIRQRIILKDTDTIVADAEVTFVIYDTKLKKTALLEGEILVLLKSV